VNASPSEGILISRVSGSFKSSWPVWLPWEL